MPLRKYIVEWSNKCEELSQEEFYLCMAASAAARNKPDYIASAVQLAIDNGYDLLRMYEALLQTYLFAGFPAALEALMTFNRVVSDNNIEFTPPAPEEYDVHEFFLRGEKLCRAVYTTVYEPMREKMSAVIPHLDEWMIVEGYGKTLSRNGLDTVTRELVIVATLASCGWRRQLYSHIRGAINVGSHPLAIKDALICSLYCGFDNSYNNALSVYEQVVTSLSE